MKSIHI